LKERHSDYLAGPIIWACIIKMPTKLAGLPGGPFPRTEGPMAEDEAGAVPPATGEAASSSGPVPRGAAEEEGDEGDERTPDIPVSAKVGPRMTPGRSQKPLFGEGD